MLESLKLAPLPLSLLPVMAQKPVAPDAPKPIKMMAAKGALPVPPEALILIWYQLYLDPDPELQSTIVETLNTFDRDLVIDQAQKDLPEHVLDWLSKTSTDPEVLEKVVLNNKTHDATIMDIAENASKEIVEIIANNHVRILRSPEIIEKIYLNPATRMATVDKLLALAKEHNIELQALKAAQQLSDIKDDVPGISDEEFADLLAESNQQANREKPEGLENLRDSKSLDEQEEQENPDQKKKRLSRTQVIEKLNAPQRVRLALMGSREDRNILIRDTRRVVYMAVVTSPKMSIGEVSSIASSKSMPDEVISYVAGRRDWVRYYPIVVALINNPKCPLSESVAFLKQLRANDLKQLAKSKSVPAQLSRQAQMMFKQKDVKK